MLWSTFSSRLFFILFSTSDLQTEELRLTAGADRMVSPVWISVRVYSLSLFYFGSKTASWVVWNPLCLSAWPQLHLYEMHWFWHLTQINANHDISRMHRWHPLFGVSSCKEFKGIANTHGRHNTALVLTDHWSWHRQKTSPSNIQIAHTSMVCINMACTHIRLCSHMQKHKTPRQFSCEQIKFILLTYSICFFHVISGFGETEKSTQHRDSEKSTR